ncbi:MAG TPA: PAS domain S-box protein, partial [Verrucomicrobiota bacterium]|nr:PAS domain S-box protein [Verrucomicrobiota bacterium]
MIVVNLVQNIAMLVMLAALYQVLEARGAGGLLKRKVLAGILFGVVTVMGIMAPVRFAPGIIFDGRSIVLSIAGLFGGPVVGFVAAAICGAYRLWLGGGGAAMGVSVAAESALVGVVFYYLRRKGRWRSDLGGLAAVGFLVHGLMLLLTFLLPAEDRPRVWRQMGLLLLTVYPAGTIFLGLLFLDYERQASARASLAASEERYRTTLASIGDAVIATDRDGRIEFMNAVAEKLTGWTTAEARGQPLETVFSIVNEQTHEPVDDPVRRVIREGKIVGLANHTLLRGRDGTERPIADSGAPIRDETGTIKGVVLTFRDQTSERAAERALRESEAKFRILTEESRTPVYVIQDGRFRYVNAAEADLLGYSREELLSLPSVLETVAHEDRQRVLENIGRRLAGDDVTLDYEFSIVRKDGARRLVEVTGTATTFDGRPAVLGTAQDITERKRAEIVRGALLSLATGLSEAHTEKDVAKSIFAAADHLWHWDAGTLEMLWQGEDKMENVLCIDTLDGVRKEVPPTGQRERPTPRIMRVMEKGPELILRTPDQMRASDSTVFGDVTRLSAS